MTKECVTSGWTWLIVSGQELDFARATDSGDRNVCKNTPQTTILTITNRLTNTYGFQVYKQAINHNHKDKYKLTVCTWKEGGQERPHQPKLPNNMCQERHLPEKTIQST